jgi:SAM-dependent methyltransferase
LFNPEDEVHMPDRADRTHWDKRYQEGDTPWDTGLPSSELVRVVQEEKIPPCRAVELGCGTGTNVIWLAQQGFEVTGVDLAPLAVQRAQERAKGAGVKVRIVAADVLNLPDLGAPFQFFFDRGCYHVVRRIDPGRYIQTVARITTPDMIGLILAGNAREPQTPGPPTVSEEEIRREWGEAFEIIWLREFRFDATAGDSQRPLAWSCLVRKRR